MRGLVEDIKHDYKSSHISPQLRARPAIAEQVQKGGKNVTAKAVADAKACGASNGDVHDTVLLAAAFCMFNRYVDGTGTRMPESREEVERMDQQLRSWGIWSIRSAPSNGEMNRTVKRAASTRDLEQPGVEQREGACRVCLLGREDGKTEGSSHVSRVESLKFFTRDAERLKHGT